MITREDLKIGLMVKQIYNGNKEHPRIGIIDDIFGTPYWACNVLYESGGDGEFTGFFFQEADLQDIEILTIETHPEYYL